MTRDRLADPFPVEITSILDGKLDPDLAALRDQFVEIKVNGARYLPWRDDIVASNIGNADERWHTAKQVIACEKMPGRDPALVYQIGARAKAELAALGYPSLDSLLQADPAALSLESIKGIGATKARPDLCRAGGQPVRPAVAPATAIRAPEKTLRILRGLRVLHECRRRFRAPVAGLGRV